MALAILWGTIEGPRQQKFISTAVIGLAFTVLLLAWALLFSRFAARTRLGIFLGFALCVALVPALFRMRGVTGDLLPILEFRWRGKGEQLNASTIVPGLNATNSPVLEASFPQFQGPNRNGVLKGIELETDWKMFPPQLMWRQNVGPSWSGFAVADGRAVTLEQRGEQEVVACYELSSGKLLWAHSDEARYATTIAGEGPRTTPTLADGKVYTLGATGILNCLELESGKKIWAKNILLENEAGLPDWGLAGSPLIYRGKVIVSAGGVNERSLVAYRMEDGAFLWGAGSAGADYSSPTVLDLLGEEQIVIFNTSGLSAYTELGQLLWDYPWRGGHPHISLPVEIGTNQVLVSSGYGTGAELITLKREEKGIQAERSWRTMAMKSKFGTMLVHGGYIYGLDDGIMTCVELKTGQRRWKDGRFGHGQALLVGDVILLMAEKGDVVLIEPNPDKLVELAGLNVFDGKTWNPPALAGEYLLVRNDEEAACFKLRGRQH